MKIKAEQKYIRQSPRKVRLVANQVRKLSLEKAMRQLAVIERKASLTVLKVIRQAIANATNNLSIPFEQLELKNILVKPGPTYKRFQAVSRGRAHQILKRTCYVEVILKTKQAPIKPTQEKQQKSVKPKKSVKAGKSQKTKKTTRKSSKKVKKKTKKKIQSTQLTKSTKKKSSKKKSTKKQTKKSKK